jgi:hypothetical protein
MRPLLENYGFAQIFIADGNPAAYFAYKSGVLYKGFVFLWIAYLIAKVVQITQVFVVAGVRQICFCHCIYLRKKSCALILYSLGLWIIANISTIKSTTAEIYSILCGIIQP